MKYVWRAAAVTFCIAALGGNTLLEAKNYPAAKALAAHLQPQGLTPKADPGGLARVTDPKTWPKLAVDSDSAK